MCLKLLGNVCSRIPDSDTPLWWETEEEFEERMSFLRDD